jgi:predicted nucleic acid-binding protein
MKSIYSDTNIFTHIHHRTGVSDLEVTRLRTAVDRDHIRILLSTQVLEETISALRNHPEEATARLELIFEMTSWTRLLKFHADLLRDEIVAYAFNKPLPSRFYAENKELKAYLLDKSHQNRAALVQVSSNYVYRRETEL